MSSLRHCTKGCLGIQLIGLGIKIYHKVGLCFVKQDLPYKENPIEILDFDVRK